jgi:hypothetical protein
MIKSSTSEINPQQFLIRGTRMGPGEEGTLSWHGIDMVRVPDRKNEESGIFSPFSVSNIHGIKRERK